MKAETRQTILNFLKDNPLATYSQLERGLPFRRPTIRRYIISLERDGIVERITAKSHRVRHRFRLVEHLSYDVCHTGDVIHDTVPV